MRRAVGPCVALLAALGAPAQAQTVTEARNFSAERFRLSLDRTGILNAESAVVPAHLHWELSLWVGYANDPLSVYRASDDSRVGDLVGDRVGAGLVLALGLFDWVELGVGVPLVLYQSRQDTFEGVNGSLADLDGFGVGGPRLVPKIRILRQEDFGVSLAFAPTFVLPAALGASYAGQDSLLFEPELLVGRVQGAFRWNANLGLRLRRPERSPDLEVDDELFAQVGAAFDLGEIDLPPVTLEASLGAAARLSDPLSQSNQTYLEGLLGAAYPVAGPLLAFAAGGVGMSRGFGTPDYRVLAGLRIGMPEDDADGDGVDDARDGCPDAPEDEDGFEDDDGCPEADNDRDGLEDAVDRAPLGPEDLDGFEDDDGRPDPDNDQDGIWDWDDACPLEPGPVVNRGCPEGDRDGDGRLDRLDRCPDAAEDVDGFEDDDGCPDPDDDDDGVLDADDACPREPGPLEGRGCPDADRDGDGIVDRLDNCPDEKGLAAERGCRKKQLVVIQGGRIDILDKVYFTSGRARIQRRSFDLLDNLAAVLTAHPELERVEVQGHTDDRGRARSNLRLSQKRAEAVVAFLVRRGIDAGRLTAKGYGEAEPIAPNQTRQGRAENRRVEFRILRRRGAAKP